MLFYLSFLYIFILLRNCKLQNIYFCVKYGKLSYIVVWGLESLKRSNVNFFELDFFKEK